MHTIDLPDLPSGLTPDWLTAALHACGFLPANVRVAGVEQTQVGDGTGMMSQLARLRIDYQGDAAALPATLIAKYPSGNEQNREVANSFGLYERETRYFAELDAHTTAVTPRTIISTLQGDSFLILMEDMAEYRVGNQAQGADLADTEAMLDELAKLHAAFWNRVDDLDWVPGIAGSYHADNMATLIKIGWPNMVEIFSDYINPDIAARGDDFMQALPGLQAAMAEQPRTLLHGDFRMENVFFGTQPDHHPVAIIDWQGPLLGRSMVDVALLLGQSTRTEVRREQEQSLIKRYAGKLRSLGVADYPDEQAWADYRLALLYNWVYVGVVAGTLDVTNQAAFAWMSQMVARQSAATLDLDVLALMQ